MTEDEKQQDPLFFGNDVGNDHDGNREEYEITILAGCVGLLLQEFFWFLAWFLTLALSVPKLGWLQIVNVLAALLSIYLVVVIVRLTAHVRCDVY